MLGDKLQDKILNSDLRRKTKVTDMFKRTDHLKWDWRGHMLRCKINEPLMIASY